MPPTLVMSKASKHVKRYLFLYSQDDFVAKRLALMPLDRHKVGAGKIFCPADFHVAFPVTLSLSISPAVERWHFSSRCTWSRWQTAYVTHDARPRCCCCCQPGNQFAWCFSKLPHHLRANGFLLCSFHESLFGSVRLDASLIPSSERNSQIVLQFQTCF